MTQNDRFPQKCEIGNFFRLAFSFLACLALAPVLHADIADESYAAAMSLNAVFPGYDQFKQQRPVEGWAALSALPLIGVGQYLFWSTLSENDGTISSDSFNVQLRPQQELAFWAGRSLSLLGLGLWSVSQWTAHRDELAETGTRCSITMADLLLAPFAPATLFDETIITPVTVVSLVRVLTLPPSTLSDFFTADSRYALGYYWHPAAALAVRVFSAGLAALGGAVATETLLRGLLLERTGLGAVMAVQGGLSLAPYVLLGPESANSTISGNDYTIVSDLLFAAYASVISQRSGDPRKAIALRFWLETILASIGYMEAIVADANGPTEGIGFGLKINY